jgi:outer membrane receptor protein involved in Fe transport
MELNLQGGLFALPAGQLRSAVGASYRKNSVAFDPDILNDQEGILDRPAGLFAANDASGSTNVKELYAEFLVPLLAGLPAIKDLSLELGGRYSDYNIEGGLFTWKGLLNWKFTDGVSFRGGYQHANRAPNTAELYTGKTTTVAGFPLSDPCANTTRAPWGNLSSNPNRAKVQALCEAIIGNTTSAFTAGGPSNYIGGNGGFFPLELELRRGNETLKSEKARTITAGLVFKSPFEVAALSNLTTSIDWYDIQVKDAISPLLSTTVYEYCFNANGSTNPTYSVNDPGGYCKLIFRDPVTGGRATVDAPYSNLGQLKTSGVDLNVGWRSALADMGMGAPGALSANLAVNYLIKFKRQDVPGAVFTDYKGTLGLFGQYTWTSSFDLGYTLNTWGMNLSWQHRASIHNATYATTPTTTLQGADAYDYFSLQGNWQVSSKVQLRAGIENLLNKDPLVVGRDPGVTQANGVTAGPYDQLGRRYYAGVKLSF